MQNRIYIYICSSDDTFTEWRHHVNTSLYNPIVTEYSPGDPQQQPYHMKIISHLSNTPPPYMILDVARMHNSKKATNQPTKSTSSMHTCISDCEGTETKRNQPQTERLLGS